MTIEEEMILTEIEEVVETTNTEMIEDHIIIIIIDTSRMTEEVEALIDRTEESAPLMTETILK